MCYVEDFCRTESDMDHEARTTSSVRHVDVTNKKNLKEDSYGISQP